LCVKVLTAEYGITTPVNNLFIHLSEPEGVTAKEMFRFLPHYIQSIGMT
jgi:hypothetical protein